MAIRFNYHSMIINNHNDNHNCHHKYIKSNLAIMIMIITIFD